MPPIRLALPALGALAFALAACSAEKPAPAGSDTAASSAPSEGLASTASDAPETPAPPSSSQAAADNAAPLSCAADIGEAAARKLAAQCRAVSPATHPPCNAANSCAMIRNEIARGCAILGEDAAKTPECGGIDPIGAAAAADLVERYYAAINARDYASAWTLWGTDGEASGKTLQAFTAGFAHTRRVHVDVGKVSDIEGGAGSIYVTVPVTIDAELDDGRRQRFTGGYDLRQINRGMGISQGWHIVTAKLRPA